MNQFNIIKIYTIFTQRNDTNSIQVPIDCKLRDTGTYPGTQNKVQKFHGLKVLKSYSLFSYHCGIMLEINIKRFMKITHVFSSAVWHLPREIFYLAIKSLNKVRLKKEKNTGWWQRRKHLNEKLVSKWEINIKGILNKIPCVWKLNIYFYIMGILKL